MKQPGHLVQMEDGRLPKELRHETARSLGTDGGWPTTKESGGMKQPGHLVQMEDGRLPKRAEA